MWNFSGQRRSMLNCMCYLDLQRDSIWVFLLRKIYSREILREFLFGGIHLIKGLEFTHSWLQKGETNVVWFGLCNSCTILFIRQQKFVQVWYVPINMIFELFIYQQAEFQYNIIIDGVFPAIFLQNWPCQPNFSIVSFKKWISEKLVKC